ncbi:MAG: transposase [Streptomyces oryziradicis]|nr:transposase [Actinacidiphila oryziradicis]
MLNALVLINTRYMDAAVQQLLEEGVDVRDEDVARLSPFVRHHINIYGSSVASVGGFMRRDGLVGGGGVRRG